MHDLDQGSNDLRRVLRPEHRAPERHARGASRDDLARHLGGIRRLRAARDKELLFETRLPDKMSATAVAANGTLYLATMNRLYAIAGKE